MQRGNKTWFCNLNPLDSLLARRSHSTKTANTVQCESKKVAPPLKLFAIFSLELSVFPWNFASMLPVYIYTYLVILVDLS